MLSNILREKNFNVRQISCFWLKIKAMLLAQCKLFYAKEFLITDYSKAFCNAILGK
jgi:hypothetical protein